MKNKFIVTKNLHSSMGITSSYIKNNDFTKIMSLFSRMLKANQWKDYSFLFIKKI